MSSESLSNYYRDGVTYDVNEDNGDNYRVNNNKTTINKSFECGTKIIGSKKYNYRHRKLCSIKEIAQFSQIT